MVGNYIKDSPGLEIRKPARLFGPLGWLAAGLLNPAGWFAWMVWGMPEFSMQMWAWHAAAPLQLAILLTLMFLREGGFGLGSVSFLTLICTLGACAVLGPVYTLLTWWFQQQGASFGTFSAVYIDSFPIALGHAGTQIRMSLAFAGVAAIPAIIILRIVALQRIPKRKPARATATAPPAAEEAQPISVDNPAAMG